jgi:hypothetical protein
MSSFCTTVEVQPPKANAAITTVNRNSIFASHSMGSQNGANRRTKPDGK